MKKLIFLLCMFFIATKVEAMEVTEYVDSKAILRITGDDKKTYEPFKLYYNSNNTCLMRTDPFINVMDYEFKEINTDDYEYLDAVLYVGRIGGYPYCVGMQLAIYELSYPEYDFDIVRSTDYNSVIQTNSNMKNDILSQYSKISILDIPYNNYLLLNDSLVLKNDFKNYIITPNSNVDINYGDNLIINPQEERHHTITFKKNDNEPYHNTSYYINSDNQMLIQAGNMKQNNFEMNIDVIKKDLVINNINKSNIYIDYQYEIYQDDLLISTIKSTENTIKYPILSTGNYCIKAINNNDMLVSEDTMCLFIDYSSNDTLDYVYDIPYQNISINLFKETYEIISNNLVYKYKEIHNYEIYALEDIYYRESIIYQKDELIDIDKIIIGRYYLKYLDNIIEFMVDNKEEYIFFLDIEKYDLELKYPTNEQHISVMNNSIKLERETNIKGVIKMDDIPKGIYYIKDVVDNLFYGNKEIVVTLNDNKTIEVDKNIVYGQIKIKSIKEELVNSNEVKYKDVLNSNQVINLYAKEDIFKNNEIVHKKDSLITNLITNEFGEITSSLLPLGKYYITSEDGLLYYEIDLHKELYNYDINIYSKYQKGSLTISTNNDAKVISLKSNELKIPKKHLDSVSKIDDLPYGNYLLEYDDIKKNIMVDKENNSVILDKENAYEYQEIGNNKILKSSMLYVILLPLLVLSFVLIKKHL